MDPLWITFIIVVTFIIIISIFEYYKFKRNKHKPFVDLNTTSSGTGVVYTIPTTQQLSLSYPSMNSHPVSTPVYIMQDTPPSYDQVVNSCPPPGSTPTATTNSTLTTTTTIHQR